MRSALHSSWRVISVALAFISIFGVRVCITVIGLSGAEQFPVHPGQQLSLQLMRVPLHVVVVLLCLVFEAS